MTIASHQAFDLPFLFMSERQVSDAKSEEQKLLSMEEQRNGDVEAPSMLPPLPARGHTNTRQVSTGLGLLSMDNLFRSNDSTAKFLKEHFETEDGNKSTVSASFISNLFRSADFQKQLANAPEEAYKSSDSWIAKLFQSQQGTARAAYGNVEVDNKMLAPSHQSGAAVASSSAANGGNSSSPMDRVKRYFTSRDWVPLSALSQPQDGMDVDLKQVFTTKRAVGSKYSDIPTTENGNVDWEAMYEAELAGAEDQAKAGVRVAAVPLVPVPPISNSRIPKPTPSLPPKRQRSSTQLDYVEPQELDVFLGRGGRTNNHKGNKQYLIEKDVMQERYMNASKPDKTTISQELVDKVHAWGGRFIKLDEASNRWYVVSERVARKKASQTLREVNTPEERAAKRAKYGKK